MTVVKREWNSALPLMWESRLWKSMWSWQCWALFGRKTPSIARSLYSGKLELDVSSRSQVLGFSRLFSVLFLLQLLSGYAWSFTLCIHSLALSHMPCVTWGSFSFLAFYLDIPRWPVFPKLQCLVSQPQQGLWCVFSILVLLCENHLHGCMLNSSGSFSWLADQCCLLSNVWKSLLCFPDSLSQLFMREWVLYLLFLCW